MKCSRCGNKLPEDEEDDGICTKCALEEWDKITNDDEDD